MYDIQTITEAIGQLSPSETHKLFLLVADHAGLIEKIVPGLPLIVHALGKQTLVDPLAETYDNWLNSNTKTAAAPTR